MVYPSRVYDLPLGDCLKAFKRAGLAARAEGAMVIVRKSDVSFTLYRTGRLLVLPCREKEEAMKRATELFSVIEDDEKISDAMKSAGSA